MTKPADDKLGHAKREIKALKLKLESCNRFASQHLGKIERLEALVESCSKRNESDCDLIDSLQEQVAELEASAVVPEPFGTESAYQASKNPILSSSNMIISSGLVRDLVEALRNSASPKQEPTQ
jgi:proline dehydrogenase